MALLVLPFVVFGAVPLGAFSAASVAMAQDSGLSETDAVTKASTDLDAREKQLEAVRASLNLQNANDRDLLAQKAKIDDVIAALTIMKSQLSPRLDEVTARLADLGAPPKQGDPVEALEVTTQRNKLTVEKTKIVSILASIDDTNKLATDLSGKISAVRRALFTQQLFAHADVSLDSMSVAIDAVGPEYKQLIESMSNWLGFVFRFKALSLTSALVLSLVLVLFLRAILHRIFGPIIERGKQEENPSYMSRFSVAFWGTILPTLAVSFYLVSSFMFLDMFNVLRPDIRQIIAAAFGFVGFVFFAVRLAIAVFNPVSPKWRLVRVTDRGSYRLVAAFVTMAVVNGLDYVQSTISEVQGWPVELTVLKGLLAAAIVGLVLILVSFTKPLHPKGEEDSQDGRPWPHVTAGLMRIIGASMIFLALLGYVGLARFIATQIVSTGGLLCTMYIGIRSGKAISERDRFAETIVGRYIQRRFSIGPIAMDQMGIVAGLLIYALAGMIGVPLIMTSWGFQPPDIRMWIFNLFTEIKIGGMSISVVGIFGGALLFVGGIVVTRWLEKWLDGNVMARAQMDPGVRNSVKTSVGYLGAILAGMMGLSAAGINLSSLALVAGALSVGIGFGLQNIISNFVSGLILLFERPFKVGDWVATGTSEGFVRRISVRATEIETFQRQSIIVPNSQLINASVGNWTHRNKLGRVEVKISAKSSNDPRHLMGLLKEVAMAQPAVLRTPEPTVVFKDFTADELEFEVRVFVADVLNGLSVRNELRLGIFERFMAEGIILFEEPKDEDAPDSD